jgi:type II secretory ATPase GspE/PulE/Tfp pilus assembly ATPase PilB-like protein
LLTTFDSGGISSLLAFLLLPDDPLKFSPIRVVVLVIWAYLCFFSVQRLNFGGLVENKYKPLVSITGLFVGPFILLILSVAEVLRQIQSGKIEPRDALKALFGMATSKRIAAPKRTIELLDSSGKSFYEVHGGGKSKDVQSETLAKAENIILNALDNRASDLLIDPKGDNLYSIRLRVDGMLKVDEECKAMINSIKSISGMDIAEKRRPQDGAFQARLSDGKAHFRVASAGVLGGQKLAIRVLDQSSGMISLDQVGLSQENYARLSNIVNQPSGMALVCGPTGSGKTTTLYAMLGTIDFSTRNVITVEDPIEHILAQVSQIEINPKADITFASALRSMLRQDPDVISVGEIRDGETAGMAVQASHTGHLVLSTLHSSSNIAAIIRMIDLGVKPLLLASALSVVISQRLVRRLCDHCKAPAELTQKQADSFRSRHVDPGSIFQPIGCNACDGTGFYGRTAILDVTYMDEELKANLTRPDLSIADFKKKGDTTAKNNLKKEALKKVLAGITTLDEVKRVISTLG